MLMRNTTVEEGDDFNLYMPNPTASWRDRSCGGKLLRLNIQGGNIPRSVVKVVVSILGGPGMGMSRLLSDANHKSEVTESKPQDYSSANFLLAGPQTTNVHCATASRLIASLPAQPDHDSPSSAALVLHGIHQLLGRQNVCRRVKDIMWTVRRDNKPPHGSGGLLRKTVECPSSGLSGWWSVCNKPGIHLSFEEGEDKRTPLVCVRKQGSPT